MIDCGQQQEMQSLSTDTIHVLLVSTSGHLGGDIRMNGSNAVYAVKNSVSYHDTS